MAFLDPVLSPVLQPLINMSPFWAITLLALVISLIVVVVYKFATNQEEMGRLKGKQKEFQQRMKELRKNPEKMMQVQKEAMQVNMEYMKHSLKATLITILPILLIFGWMTAHLAYEPIYPGETFSVSAIFAEGITGDVELIPSEGLELKSDATQEANSGIIEKLPRGYFSGDDVAATTWRLSGEAGEHVVTVKYDGIEQSKDVLITTEVLTKEAVATFDHSDLEQIQINYKKLRPLGSNSIFGWQPGWFGLYVLFSIVFSIVLRKLFKVH